MMIIGTNSYYNTTTYAQSSLDVARKPDLAIAEQHTLHRPCVPLSRDGSVKKTENVESKISRKTAADELTYLSDKFKDYSFVSANYSQGMRYGTSMTTNVAISPQFLAKMANDPELETEYIQEIGNMRELDEQFIQGQAARGWKVVAQGWAIDKDGGISSWAITTKDNKTKSFLQKMSEKSDEIRQAQLEKAKEEKRVHKKEDVQRKGIDLRL